MVESKSVIRDERDRADRMIDDEKEMPVGYEGYE